MKPEKITINTKQNKSGTKTVNWNKKKKDGTIKKPTI